MSPVPPLLAYFTTTPDLDELRSRLLADRYAEDLALLSARVVSGDAAAQLDESTVASCLAVTLANTEEFVDGYAIATGMYEGSDAIFYAYLAETLEDSVIVVQDADDCAELGRAGP